MMVGDRICISEVGKRKTLPRLEEGALLLQMALCFRSSQSTLSFWNCQQKSDAADGQELGKCLSGVRQRMLQLKRSSREK